MKSAPGLLFKLLRGDAAKSIPLRENWMQRIAYQIELLAQ